MKKTLLTLFCIWLFSWDHLCEAATLNLNLFIEVYYLGSHQMSPYLFNCGLSTNPSACDSLIIDLHDTVPPYNVIATSRSILYTDGSATFNFTNSIVSKAYYISVRNRDLIEIWSAVPLVMAATTNYDFTTARSKTYGSNMVNVGGGIYAAIIGDINHDGNVDLLDFPLLDFAINNGLCGYRAEDLNSNCCADLLDFPILDNAINIGLYSQHP